MWMRDKENKKELTISIREMLNTPNYVVVYVAPIVYDRKYYEDIFFEIINEEMSPIFKILFREQKRGNITALTKNSGIVIARERRMDDLVGYVRTDGISYDHIKCIVLHKNVVIGNEEKALEALAERNRAKT